MNMYYLQRKEPHPLEAFLP